MYGHLIYSKGKGQPEKVAYGHLIYSKGKVQPEKVANLARGQLNREQPWVVTHIARIWINRVRLPILLVVS